MKETDIRRFIEEKSDWIKRKQVRARKEAVRPHQFTDGETFWYQGKELPLRLVRDGRPGLVMMDGAFRLAKSAQPRAGSVFEAWYKKQARAVLAERVDFFARKYGFEVSKIRISSARTRWGSCSRKGTLSFTWKLVMAPPEVVDYVVVHELCHLRVLNHSPSFWAQVEAILPDYKAKRKWLKANGGKLQL
jgi:predicted metal-dependent hydrolase